MPTVSCIILNYNHKNELGSVIECATQQTIPFDEILIVDDNSKDGSVAEIKKLTRGAERVSIIARRKNLGVARGIKDAIEKASCEFIFLMSMQITYSKQLVEEFHESIKRHPRSLMVSGNIQIITKHNKLRELRLPFANRHTGVTPDLVLDHFSRGVFTFFGGANFLHKQSIIDNKLYVEGLKWHADWYVYIMLSMIGNVAISQKVFAVYSYKSGRYSDAIYKKSLQNPVTRVFLDCLHNLHPASYERFRISAILPYYSIGTLFLIIRSSDTRDYLSVKLIYRCLLFFPLRRLSSLVPKQCHHVLRAVLRI